MASNSKSKGTGQSRKMMNNFIDSLDLVGNSTQYNTNAYARKAMQSQGTTKSNNA
jgi:hypothetical protein